MVRKHALCTWQSKQKPGFANFPGAVEELGLLYVWSSMSAETLARWTVSQTTLGLTLVFTHGSVI